MKVLVINSGSSSLKFQLLNMQNESMLVNGLVERIGIKDSRLVLTMADGDKKVINEDLKNHGEALKLVLDSLIDPKFNLLKSLDQIDAVGHRVVHGGEKYTSSILVDEDVKEGIKECFMLAPLHNPANLTGIEAIEKLLPGVKNVAVFDTAFHSKMPEKSYIYALPYEYYEKYKVRKYGFHGTSHLYVSKKCAELLNKDYTDFKVVTCHLGNGASVAAVRNGISVETSMGFTPLEGLAMGTRCGDIDPAIIDFVMLKEGINIHRMNEILNKRSGVLGISGISSDFRDLEDAKSTNPRAKLALDVFSNKVKKYIAAYAAVMGGIDAVVFTGGIGENGIEMREDICEGLSFMGIELDKEKNNVRGKEKIISKDGTKVSLLVVPTNEELTIARDTVKLAK